MIDLLGDIPGQQRVKNILSKFQPKSSIPHALLFIGPDGVGKEFVAVRFAQSINSNILENGVREKRLKQISSLSEPYVKYIIPLPRGKNETDSDGPTDKLTTDDIKLLQTELGIKAKNLYHKISLPGANNIKINSIRSIKKFLSMQYEDVAYRFIIISSAHLMNEAAQNALLKNLEEPPKGVVFILVTPFPERLRETIRSRCWKINFDPLSTKELTQVLTNNYNIDTSVTNSVVQFAEGSVTNALKLIDMDIRTLVEKTISILRYSFGKKYNSAFEEFNNLLADRNTENIRIILKMIIIWLNDLQKHKSGVDQLFFAEHKETLEKFNSKFPDVELNDIVFKLDKLSSSIKNNININLLVANIIFELSALTTPQVSQLTTY
jgi:DNA polymerase III subunit delta'